MTLLDDISGQLHDVCLEELMNELWHAADEMDVRVTRVETGFGPVFIFRDQRRVTLAEATKLVFAERPPVSPQ